MKILVVDDSKAMRLIVRRSLRQAGFGDCEVAEAADGKLALDAIRTAPPDLVLSDWNMPEMTGIELLEELRREGRGVRFGFVTTESTAEMRARAQQAGALFLLAKPFTAEDLRDAGEGKAVNATIADWLAAAEASVAEVASTALACSRVARVSGEVHGLRSPFGAYVPLVAANCQVQIGVVAEWDACQALARALFGLDPGAELEADTDVADALGEIANMVAGCVKAKMNAGTPGLNTGLPLCVTGEVEPSAGAEHASIQLSFDAIFASVRVLISPNGDPASARMRALARTAAKGG